MTKRKDHWSDEQDKLLAAIVIQNIRNGKTQIAGFEEAAARLERTYSGCGFRWNSEVRKQYESEIKIAKSEKYKDKVKPILLVSNQQKMITSENDDSSLDTIISLANNSKKIFGNFTNRIKILEAELEDKNRIVEDLKNQLEMARATSREFTISEDYKELLRILNHARDIGALNDERSEEKKSLFKMDGNGNLEKIM